MAPEQSPAESAARWEHFSHGADIGIRGIGPTIDAAFAQAGLALTAVLTNPDDVVVEKWVDVNCEAPNTEVLLVDWLNTLVYEMACRRMLFGAFEVHIDDGKLSGRAGGQQVDLGKHDPAVEVKGATYTSLCVDRRGEEWVAQCVVDV